MGVGFHADDEDGFTSSSARRSNYARRYPFHRFTLKHVVNQWGGGQDRASINDLINLKVLQFVNHTVYTFKDVRRHVKHEVTFEVQAQ